MGFREVTISDESQLKELRFKNGKDAVKHEVTGKMMKGRGNRVVDWIWRLCNMASENGVVPED